VQGGLGVRSGRSVEWREEGGVMEGTRKREREGRASGGKTENHGGKGGKDWAVFVRHSCYNLRFIYMYFKIHINIYIT
jgi:hypothetical protein